MIYCFLNVSYHPEGFDLHLKNLSWALDDVKYHVFVQTLSSYTFKEYKNVTYYKHIPKNGWIDFLDYMGRSIPKDGDAYLFLQADNFFTTKINQKINLALEQNCLIIDYTNFYSFYKQKKMFYPRISEVGLIAPPSIVNRWLNEELTFGISPKKYQESFLQFQDYQILCMHNNNLHFQDLNYHITKDVRDTFFEPSLYCLINQIPYLFWGDQEFIHWQKPETFHWRFPNCRKSAKNLLDLSLHDNILIKKYINNVALMYFLTNIYDFKDDGLKSCISYQGPYFEKFYKEVNLFSKNSHEWMNNKTQDRLEWIKSILNIKHL